MSDFELSQEQDGVVSLELINHQRNELLRLLDRATDGWIEFMDKVGQYLGPVASKAGRPSAEDRKGTMLEPLGFSTWRKMIETERENGGLGWNFSTYQQWRKAYAVLKQIPDLREQKLTPAEINRLATQLKKSDPEGKLPKNVDAWDAGVEQVQAEKQQAKVEQEANLKQELLEASQKLSDALQANAVLTAGIEAEKRLTDSQEATINDLRTQVAEGNKAITCLTEKMAGTDADIKRIAGERNEAVKAVNNWKGKAAQTEKELKLAKSEISSLTSTLNKLKSLSLIKRILKKWD